MQIYRKMAKKNLGTGLLHGHLRSSKNYLRSYDHVVGAKCVHHHQHHHRCHHHIIM